MGVLHEGPWFQLRVGSCFRNCACVCVFVCMEMVHMGFARDCLVGANIFPVHANLGWALPFLS
jgi:hypothetical protein